MGRGNTFNEEGNEEIQLGIILNAVLKKSQKSLCSLNTIHPQLRNQRLKLMSSLAGIRIIVARYVALYRWHKNHQPLANSSPSIQNMISNQALIQNAFQSFKSLFTSSPSFNQQFQPAKISEINISKSKIHRNPIELYTKLVNSMFTTFDTKIYYHNHSIFYLKPQYYQFSIKIKGQDKFKLKSFTLFFSKEIKNYIRTNHSTILENFANSLARSVCHSENPIQTAQDHLQQFYLYETYLFISNTIISLQHHYNFSCKFDKTEFRLYLTFSDQYSPYNQFDLCIENNSIYLISKTILNKKFYNTLFPIPLHSQSQIESIISQISEMLHETKKEKLNDHIQKSLDELHLHQFQVINSPNSIDFSYGHYFISLQIDKLTGRISFKGNESIISNYQPLIPLIEKVTSIKFAVEMLFLHSLLSSVSNFVQLDFSRSFSQVRHILNYSSSPLFSTEVVQYRKSTLFNLLNRHKVSILPNLILPINYLYPTLTTLKILKIKMIYSQISMELSKKGLHSYLQNESIQIVIDSIDLITLKIFPSFYWILKIATYQRKATFSGNSITCRFPKWVASFAVSLSTFITIYRQALDLRSISPLTYIIHPEHFTCFSIRFGDSQNMTTLRVSLSPFKSQQRINLKSSYYTIYSNRRPSIKFDFFEKNPLVGPLVNLYNNGQIRLLFGSFLHSSIRPLLSFYRVFAHSNKWSTALLRTDGSFYLIYNKNVTINFTLNSSQMFTLTIPVIGRSKELQIPLSSLPNISYFPKLSHPTYKISQSFLPKLKELLETFFNIKDSLTSIGFDDFVFRETEFIAKFPKRLNYADIKCIVKPTSFEFKIEGDNEIARNIDIIMNHQFENNDIHLSIVRFVINVLDFDQKFAAYILYFASKMIAKTDSFKINWSATMERTAVTLSQHRVIFHFVTDKSSFCIEFSKKSKDPSPDIVCYAPHVNETHFKTMKELAYWIHMITLDESQ